MSQKKNGKKGNGDTALAVAEPQTTGLLTLPDELADLAPAPLPPSAHQTYMPLLKIVQKASGSELKARFGEGSAVLGDEIVARYQESFTAVVVYRFDSWAKKADLKDRGGDFIVEETLDSRHPLVALCKNRNTRKEPYANNETLFYKNMEQINFIIITDSGRVARVIYSGGSHKMGFFLSEFFDRVIYPPNHKCAGERVPTYALKIVFTMDMATDKSGNEYYLPNHAAAAPPWVKKASVERYAAAYHECAKAYQAGTIINAAAPVAETPDE